MSSSCDWTHPTRRTVDHKQPRGRGGQDVPENRVDICRGCNGLKGDMTEAEFRTYLDTYGFMNPAQLKSRGVLYGTVKAMLRQSFTGLPQLKDMG